MAERDVPDRPLLSVAEACRLTGWSESKGFALARQGLFPGQVDLPGHRRLIRRAVLLAWLNGEAVPVAPPRLRAVS